MRVANLRRSGLIDCNFSIQTVFVYFYNFCLLTSTPMYGNFHTPIHTHTHVRKYSIALCLADSALSAYYMNHQLSSYIALFGHICNSAELIRISVAVYLLQRNLTQFFETHFWLRPVAP